MTPEAQKIKEKLERKEALVDRKVLNQLVKDRLDFGFDSIYFRYSEAIEELGWYKEQEAHRERRDFDRKSWCNTKRQHFYMCLEQLLHAHEQEDI